MFKFYSNKDLDTLTFKNFHTGLQSNFLGSLHLAELTSSLRQNQTSESWERCQFAQQECTKGTYLLNYKFGLLNAKGNRTKQRCTIYRIPCQLKVRLWLG